VNKQLNLITPALRRGQFFTHAFWLDESNMPLVCEVTAVRFGCVYWRDANSFGPARDCFRIEHTSRYVKAVK